MTRRGSDFSGLSVAIVTPFKDGKLDKDALKKQVEFQIEAGTDCLVPVGTTGESPTLSHPEHEVVIGEVIRIADGRAKVMAGTGSNATAEAISLTQWAEREGADATLQVAPYYNRPTQEGMYQHYKAVSEATSLPICVYNIPGRTGQEYRTGNDCPNRRIQKRNDGQRSNRLGRSSLSSPVAYRFDGSEW